MGEACFSVPVLAVLTPIAGAIVAGLVSMYRDGIRSRDAQIVYLTAELTEANTQMRLGSRVMGNAKSALRGETEGRRTR